MNLLAAQEADHFPMPVQRNLYHNRNKITQFSYKPKRKRDRKVHEYKKKNKSKAITYMESR